jgi:predicted metalloendopeptidase
VVEELSGGNAALQRPEGRVATGKLDEERRLRGGGISFDYSPDVRVAKRYAKSTHASVAMLADQDFYPDAREHEIGLKG